MSRARKVTCRPFRHWGRGLSALGLALLALPAMAQGCAQGEEDGAGGSAGAGGGGAIDAADAQGDAPASDTAVVSDVLGDTPSSDTFDEPLGDAPTDSPPEAAHDAAAGGCQCDSPGCGACPVVAMISVTGFQIDSIEVTNAQYAGFLAAQPDPSLQPPACASNATFEPSQGWPATGQEALPVTNTDWCDARAFCHWARKHLCGAVGGGASSYDDFANANTDQWQRACTGAGARNYPYGNTYEAATCNGSDQGSNQKVPAGEVSCQGAYPGLFDMSGNVWEWEDACQSDAVGALCRIRGGCFLNGAPNLRCDTDSSTSRLDSHPTVGFRCCRD